MSVDTVLDVEVRMRIADQRQMTNKISYVHDETTKDIGFYIGSPIVRHTY